MLESTETRRDPASDPAQPVNGAPAKPVYEWDRTISEDAERARQTLISKAPFPTPKNTTMGFAELCEYYNALRELPVGRYAKLYVQRYWPVLLPVDDIDDFGNVKDSFPSDVKITAEDGPLSQQIILQLAGVGEYKFRLNDSRRPWKQQTVVFSDLAVTDPSFWTLHPPIIDPKRIDLDAKRNQAYIKFARAHGYLPHEGAVEKEESEMANAAVVTQLLEQNKHLTEQVTRKEPAPPPPAPVVPVKAEPADGGAMKAVVDLATAALNRPQPAPAPASDPMVMVRGMVDIIKEIKPAPDTSATDLAKQVVAQAEAANTRIYQLQADQMATIRQELKEAKTPAAVPASPVTPPTRRQMLEDAVAEQQLLKQLAGRGGSSTAEEEKPSNVDKWLEAAPVIGPVIQTFLGGIFQTIQYGLQTWQNVAHNNALAKNGASTPANPTEPMKPTPAPPTLTPEQQAQQNQLMIMLRALDEAAEPIGKSFLDGDSGATFAAMVIKFRGRPAYDLIRAMGQTGPSQFDVNRFVASVRALLMHPQRTPRIARLAGDVLEKQSFKDFLESFFNHDEIAAQEESE